MVRRGDASYTRADDGDVHICGERALAALLRERIRVRGGELEGLSRVQHGQGRARAGREELEHLLVLGEDVEEDGEDGHGGDVEQQRGERDRELHPGSVGGLDHTE